jgi:uncharacterized protein (TIRG00374 family)
LSEPYLDAIGMGRPGNTAGVYFNTDKGARNGESDKIREKKLKKFIKWLNDHHAWRQIGVLLVLGAAVYFILPQITILEKAWNVIKSLVLWAVGLALIFQALSYLGNGYLLQSILEIAHDQLPLWRNTLIILGSYSIGMVAGGLIGTAAVIYRWTSGSRGSIEGATLASVFLPQFNTLMLILFSFFGLARLIIVHSLTQAQLFGFGAVMLILALAMGGVALVVRYRAQAVGVIIGLSRRLMGWFKKPFDPSGIQREADNLYDAWDALWLGAWHRPLIGAFLNTAFDLLTLYFLFIAAGENISLGVLLAGYGLPLLLGKVAFILPGGVGVVESSMAALYSGFGVPPATAVVAVLGYRLISFWIPTLLGFPVAAYLQGTRASSEDRSGN